MKNSVQSRHPVQPTLTNCLPRRVEDHAAATPDAMAIVYGEWRLSYRDLNAAANRLAHRLLALGVGREPGSSRPVGLCLDRGPDLLVALLAVLKTGASYLALDPAWPPERLGQMVAMADPGRIISRAALRQLVTALDPSGAVPVFDLDREQNLIRGMASTNPGHTSLPGDDCYLMFTSGSTGTPKCVAITHGNLEGLFPPLADALELGPHDVWTWFHSCSFGFSAWEIWGALLHGGCLVVVPEPDRAEPTVLGDLLIDEQVTVFSQTPSAFRRLLDAESFHAAVEASRLRYIALSGEAVRTDDLSRWLARHGEGRTRLISTYAITETGGQLTLRDYRPGDDTDESARNIGRPLAGRTALVLDEYGAAVAGGEAGELWVAGDGVAAGYRGDPEATAERFRTVTLPSGTPARTYRTGDSVRALADGSLEYLGRIDAQIKFRGHRIEPGEVEAALRAHPAVRDAAVALRDDATGAPRLVGYVVANGDAGVAATTRQASADGVGFWPSIGDWGLYDEFLYGLMNAEPARLAAYREAFARHVPGKAVLDMGTGQDAVLARLCAEAGARHVYAVEILPDAARRARQLVAELGLADRITVIEGDVAAIALPETVDVCTQGVIGNVGSADGIVAAWNAARRLFAPGCVPVPRRCVTRIAAVELPASVRHRPCFDDAALPYVHRLFSAVGEAFDLRLCVRGLPGDALLTESSEFEVLDFGDEPLPAGGAGSAVLRATRGGVLDGLLLWTVVTVDDDTSDVDYLEHQQAWLPVFLPVADEPVPVAAGDLVSLEWEIVADSDQDRPDYRVSGRVSGHLSSGLSSGLSSPLPGARPRATAFECESPHHAAGQGYTAIHRALLRNAAESSPALSVTALRAWLGTRLPEYMIPQSWRYLDALPLNPAGKLDRGALPAPGRERPALAIAWVAPGTPLQAALAALWSEALGLERVGADDDFFDLGGDSITAVQLTTATQRWLDDAVPLAALFDAPTVATMAAWLERHHGDAVKRRLRADMDAPAAVVASATPADGARDIGEL